MPSACVAYKCLSGHKREIERLKRENLPIPSTFKPPNEKMRKIWEARVSRKNWKMKPDHRLCELHFAEDDIIKDFGDPILGQRQKKMLKPDAVPVHFAHKQLQPPPKRKPPSSRRHPPSPEKRQKTNQQTEEEISEETMEEDVCNDEEAGPANPPEDPNFYKSLHENPDMISLPDDWMVRKKTNLAYLHVNDEIVIDKYVMIEPDSDLATVFIDKTEVPALKCKVASYVQMQRHIERVNAISLCPGSGLSTGSKRSRGCEMYLEESMPGNPTPRCQACSIYRKSGLRREERQRKAALQRAKKSRTRTKILFNQKKKLSTLEEKLSRIMSEYDNLKEQAVGVLLSSLPPAQQTMVKSCISCAKAKTANGRRYSKEWIYECILMRYKGPALYRKLRRDNTLPLPSPRTIQRYIKKLNPSYGFQSATFELLAKKMAEMPADERRGSILLDEMKLTEGLKYEKTSMKISGFVDMGEHTSEEDQEKIGDHALVLIFQPFKGQWIQTVAAFLTKGAAKGKDLFAITLDAIARLEQCGIFVDTVVTDGASWNRTMWAEFGMIRSDSEAELDEGEDDVLAGLESEEKFQETLSSQLSKPVSNLVTSTPRSKKSSRGSASKRSVAESSAQHRSDFVSCEHPCDSQRRLWFTSDFPHLVKTIKQRVLAGKDLITPDGTVNLRHWRAVFDVDKAKGIRVAPKLNADHFRTTGYLTMKVGLAFSFFSEEVAVAMEHYSKMGVTGLEDCQATVLFIRRINKLIVAMNANTATHSLRSVDSPNEDARTPDEPANGTVCPDCMTIHSEYGARGTKTSRQYVEEFLKFLRDWENSKAKRINRLTSQTAFGLRVTLTGALELTDYLTSEKIGFKYLMTRRINQDALEHFFGKTRQACGANQHPDPIQFIQIFRLLSVASLIKPPRGSNITKAEMLQSLLSVNDLFTEQNTKRRLEIEEKLDEALDSGDLIDDIYVALGDHTYHSEESLHEPALKSFTGYVARKARKTSTARTCEQCFQSLSAPEDQPYSEMDCIIHAKSRGYLITPSDELYQLIRALEISVLQTLKVLPLSKNIIINVIDHVKSKTLLQVGCPDHKRRLTKDIISFYLNTRLIFACEDFNRYTSEAAEKRRNAKQLVKQQRLVA